MGSLGVYHCLDSRGGGLHLLTSLLYLALRLGCVAAHCQPQTLASCAPSSWAMTHFFRLETAQLLFEKLTRDLARVERWPNDVDMAFDFFLTADAILDWLYPGPSAQHQREDLHNDPLLRAVRELAIGANPLE